jgi:hypothetical protein
MTGTVHQVGDLNNDDREKGVWPGIAVFGELGRQIRYAGANGVEAIGVAQKPDAEEPCNPARPGDR